MHLPTRRQLVRWVCEVEDDPARVECLRSGETVVAQALSDHITNPAHCALFAQLLIQASDEGFLELDHPARTTDQFGQDVGGSLMELNQSEDIRTTTRGREWAGPRQGGNVTFNLENSPVGQLAGGNIANLSIENVLVAAERQLEELDADETESEGARNILAALRGNATAITVGAGGGLAAQAIARAIGLG